MPLVIFILPNSTVRSIEAANGTTVMQAASEAGIPGIVAECGGSAMCATCHVYVDPAWSAQLPGALGNEREMLECTAAVRTEHSRLSCQIRLSDELDGLVITIPEHQ